MTADRADWLRLDLRQGSSEGRIKLSTRTAKLKSIVSQEINQELKRNEPKRTVKT